MGHHCNIAVLCMQETGVATHIETFFNDYMLILSGTTKSQEDGGFYFGVGFLVAPWAIQSVINYKLILDGFAIMKLKVRGGVLHIISARAPHGGFDCGIRRNLFDQLAEICPAPNRRVGSVILGDLNARLSDREPGDEDIIGDHMFRS
eukprot:3414917-Pyramimonas_sp.AAC.1